jgi:ESCRT-I complex subunit TSG101
MVHDPRVTTLLSRLGGLYRDPSRVDRDAASLLKSSAGIHLTPGIAPLVENNGDSSHCLVLQGTIAMVFRGQTYQLLVDIYLPPGYPIRPPVSYVRLAPNMYLKENHAHVGSDGMVYLPYTHEWNPRSHTLIEMVIAMSSVFSADPPVFTRSAAPAPPQPPPPPPPSSSLPPPPAYTSTSTSSSFIGNNKPSADSERYIQEQIDLIVAREAEEANRVAERAAKEEEEKAQQIAAQKTWEDKKTEQIRDQVNSKIQAHLLELAIQTKQNVQNDWRDQQKLEKSKAIIADELEYMQKTKQSLEQHISTVDKKTQDIEQWLETSKESKQEEVSVDDLVQPVTSLHSQMLDLSAENAALTDALYFLDRGFYMSQMDCTTHLKAVRKLAKRQFLVRAHLIKINQAMLANQGAR